MKTMTLSCFSDFVTQFNAIQKNALNLTALIEVINYVNYLLCVQYAVVFIFIWTPTPLF